MLDKKSGPVLGTCLNVLHISSLGVMQTVADRQTGRQSDRQTDRQAGRQTDRQAEEQADRQTDRVT